MMTNAINPLKWGKKIYPHPGKFLGTGNRCAHKSNKPAWFRWNEPVSKNIPYEQKKFINALKGYFYNRDLLPTLSNPKNQRNQDGGVKRNRSEAAEAEVLVLSALTRYTDFASLLVGTPKSNGEFSHRSMGVIAKAAGLLSPKSTESTLIPSHRFWRCVGRLKRAALITVHTQYEKIEGEFDILPDGTKKQRCRARPAIKSLKREFFLSLGCMTGDKFDDFRKFSSEKATKAREKFKQNNPIIDDVKAAVSKLIKGAALGEIFQKPRKNKPATVTKVLSETQQTHKNIESHSRRIIAVMETLRTRYPDQPARWYRDQAEIQLADQARQ